MDDPHKITTVPASKLIDEAGSDKVLNGRAHQRCEGCGGYHGSTNKLIHCLEQALTNARRQLLEMQNDPDLARGREVRRAFEGFKAIPTTTGGSYAEQRAADKRGKRR